MPSRLDRCLTLRYRHEQSWCPFPGWAQFFIRVGWDLRSSDPGLQRIVIAVCVPHRALAASLAALGAVLAEPLPVPTPDDIRQHFEHLLNLPDPAEKPTALTYLRAGRKIRGLFDGAVTQGQTRFVRVCVQARGAYRSGGLTYLVKEADAINIQIEPYIQPALGFHPGGTALVSHGEFVKHFYTEHQLYLLHLAARCQVLIIGRVNAIREETTQLQCAIPAMDGRLDEGVLNSILRIRKFISQADHARTAVCAAHRDLTLSPEDRAAVQLVIFDGAGAFSKWGGCFPRANLLVILDRTEPMFEEGLNQVNARYYVRSGEYRWQPGTQIPASLDAVGFVEVQ